MPYSASELFVSCGIPSFYELLRKCICDFSVRISRNTNSILRLAYPQKYILFHPLDNGGVQYYFNYKPFYAHYLIVVSKYLFIKF